MKYRRVVNRRLDDAASSAEDPDDVDPALVARCWPDLDDATLPRVVQRSGHAVLDEGWQTIDDDQSDDRNDDQDDTGEDRAG